MDGGLPFCRGWLRSRSELRQTSDEQPLTNQVDFGWALWKAQKSAAFSQKAKNYLLDKVGQGRKLVRQPPLMWLPECPVYRQDRPEMLSETDWLIEQQIARYFSRLSVLTKVVLLKRSPSVSMNEDEKADADDLASEVESGRTRQKIRRDLIKFWRRLRERVQLLLGYNKYRSLHLTFLSDLLSFPRKTTGHVFGFFHQGKFSKVSHVWGIIMNITLCMYSIGYNMCWVDNNS